MTYQCPIDGAELKDGQPCKVHGVAYSDSGLSRQNAGTLAVARPMSRAATDDPAPTPRRRKASAK